MAWQKGQSGNLKGRPPSTHALAEYIRANVEPKKLADVAISIMENVNAEDKDRLTATKFLADHGWSKPAVAIEIDKPQPLDLSTMTTEELTVLERLDAAQPEDSDGEPPTG